MNIIEWIATIMHFYLAFLAFTLILAPGDTFADIVQGISVPQYAFAGDSANIGCEYDLRQRKLYSLKWYHNGTEFYRYVPTERKTPINIRPTQKFVLHEVSRDNTKVELSLSRLTPFATGTYRCEVIAEHPSFRTDAKTAVMKVLREPLYPPLIVGLKEIYEPEDMIELHCQPMMPRSTGPQPYIKWYLDGQLVILKGDSYTKKKEKKKKTRNVTLKIPAKKIADSGGSARAECRLGLGNHQEKTSKVIKVSMTKISFVNPLSSTGSGLPSISALAAMFSACVFLNSSF